MMSEGDRIFQRTTVVKYTILMKQDLLISEDDGESEVLRSVTIALVLD